MKAYLFITAFMVYSFGGIFAQGNQFGITSESLSLDKVRPARYARSVRDFNGDVHVMGLFKVSLQADGSFMTRAQYDPVFPSCMLNEAVMNTFYSRPGLFIALNNRLEPDSGYVYTLKIWRSKDNLTTITEGKSYVYLPEAGKVNFGRPGEWAGLFCHRSILESKDGALLAAMYGNFEEDTIRPTHPQSRIETRYKLRAFVVRSLDEGRTWHYLASLAVPEANHPDDSEGYNEWTMIRLRDGRIMAVIRTGHFTPFVTCYSRDEGKTWTSPLVNSDLGPGGCDPELIRLSDGRIALSYGEMVQPEVGDDQYFEAYPEHADLRRRCRLAISNSPGAAQWHVYDITGYGDRSAYSSIFEMKPGLLLYQSDLELYRVEVP